MLLSFSLPKSMKKISDGSGWKIFDPGQVSYLWFGLENFPLKIPNFSIFSLWIIKSLQVGSKST